MEWFLSGDSVIRTNTPSTTIEGDFDRQCRLVRHAIRDVVHAHEFAPSYIYLVIVHTCSDFVCSHITDTHTRRRAPLTNCRPVYTVQILDSVFAIFSLCNFVSLFKKKEVEISVEVIILYKVHCSELKKKQKLNTKRILSH